MTSGSLIQRCEGRKRIEIIHCGTSGSRNRIYISMGKVKHFQKHWVTTNLKKKKNKVPQCFNQMINLNPEGRWKKIVSLFLSSLILIKIWFLNCRKHCRWLHECSITAALGDIMIQSHSMMERVLNIKSHGVAYTVHKLKHRMLNGWKPAKVTQKLWA